MHDIIYMHDCVYCMYLPLLCVVILQYWNMGVLSSQCKITETAAAVTKGT